MRNCLRRINQVAGKTNQSKVINAQKQKDVDLTFTRLAEQNCQKTIRAIQDEQLAYLREVRAQVPAIEAENEEITNHDNNLLRLISHINKSFMGTIQLDRAESQILTDINNLKNVKNDPK